MNTRTLSVGFVSLALLAGVGTWTLAQQPPAKAPAKETPGAKESDDEVEIKLADAPAPVRSAAIKVAGDAKNIGKVTREEDDEDVMTYEVEYTLAGVKCAAVFSPAGDLMELEKAVPDATLPAAALAALKKEYPKATFADPELVTKLYYEVHVVVDGKKHAVKVNAAGAIEDESEGDEKGEKKEKGEKGEKQEHSAAPGKDGWRADFPVNKADLSPTGVGAYFVLQPGRTMTYAGGDTQLVVTVTSETRVIDGVTTRVVEERESKAGALAEVSRNFFALDPKTGDAYYFGEEVDIYKNGKVVKHEGEWQSGKDGASFGLFIPGAPRLGDKYYQELAPGKALDRFEIVSLSEKVTTPAGAYENVVKTEETTPLEGGKENKWFAKGIGMIRDSELSLTKVEPGTAKK